MPATFLSSLERNRLDQLPPISELDLQQGYYLTQADKDFIGLFHSSINRLAIATQVCLIRYYGFIADEWKTQVKEILPHISSQLGFSQTSATILDEYGKRAMTRTFHLQQILKYLHFRKWQPIDEPLYQSWLIGQGMEHDNQRWLLEKLCNKLHQEKILRPAIGTLERIIGGIDELIHQETYKRLASLWHEDLFKQLDALLINDFGHKITLHRWLCSVPTSNTPKCLNQALEKIAFLQNMKVNSWDISIIPANRKKRLANIVRSNSNHYLQRLKSERRYPMLVCFLTESLLDITDSVLTIYNDFWTQAFSDSKKSLETYQYGLIKSQNQAVSTLTKTVEMVIDETIDNQNLREIIFDNLSKEQIQDALNVILKISRPLQQSYLHFLVKSYSRFKQFSVNLLNTLDFKIAFTKDNFGNGLNLVKEFQGGVRRKLPESAPTHFISQSWFNFLFLARLLF